MSKILTVAIFYDVYKPFKNPYQPDGTAFGDILFETHGVELDFILTFVNDLKRSQRVWTIVEVDGKMYITAGYHIVNRIGYVITEKEWETGVEELCLDDEENNDELVYVLFKDDYTDREFHDLIRLQCGLPQFCDIIDRDGEINEEYRHLFHEGASVRVAHENIRITDEEALQTFLLEDAGTTNSIDERIKDLIFGCGAFQLAGDGDGLGFILDVWETPESMEDDEPIGSYQLWFEDYEE